MSEEPKVFYAKAKKPLLQNKRVISWGVAGLCFLLFFVLYLNAKPAKKTVLSSTSAEEPRAFYTINEIENLIKDQLTEELDKQEEIQHKESQPKPKRKLNSNIAVFVKENKEERVATATTKQSQELGIPTGVKIKAHLANAIFSFNVSSPVLAVVDEDYVKDDVTYIPKGTQFIGDAGIVKSRDRVNVKFSVMVLPDGREMPVKAMALGLDGSGGIQGDVDKQYDRSMLKAAGETVLAGAALVLGTRDRAVTLEDELRLNAARNLTDDAQEALSRVRIEESITVEAYTPILILLLEAI